MWGRERKINTDWAQQWASTAMTLCNSLSGSFVMNVCHHVRWLNIQALFPSENLPPFRPIECPAPNRLKCGGSAKRNGAESHAVSHSWSVTQWCIQRWQHPNRTVPSAASLLTFWLFSFPWSLPIFQSCLLSLLLNSELSDIFPMNSFSDWVTFGCLLWRMLTNTPAIQASFTAFYR